MKLSNFRPIGTTFKKENIFLATLLSTKSDTESKVRAIIGDKIPEDDFIEKEFFEKMVESEVITSEEVDIFYKDEKGYTRFVEEGTETFVGDNSDGKGVIQNIVSVWDYYSEEEIKEGMINDSFISILVTTNAPLYRYNEDYNG